MTESRAELVNGRKVSLTPEQVVDRAIQARLAVHSGWQLLRDTMGQVRNTAGMVGNALLTRRALLSEVFDDRRDIDEEAGYPKEITPYQYQRMYERELGRRVVRLWPEESWKVKPTVYETADEDETPFEQAWNDLDRKRHLLHYLQRIDVLSGVGRYGVLWFGFDDGKKPSEPVEPGEGLELLWLRTFTESSVLVHARNSDPKSDRFGEPDMYQLTLSFEGNVGSADRSPMGTTGGSEATSAQTLTFLVHWSRVLHVADNREESEAFGIPRQQAVFNRLLDYRKVMAGDGEMFWKAAWPGLAVEGRTGSEIDTSATATALASYFNGLQRGIAVNEAEVKQLAPNISDPRPHTEVILEAIALILGVPKRKLMGSEQGELASTQDSTTWAERVAGRREDYLTPMLIRPFVDRLISLGVLPEPADGPDAYLVEWPSVDEEPSELDKAKVASEIVKAVALWIQSGADAVIPLAQLLGIVLRMDHEEVQAILDAAEEQARMLDEEEAEEPKEPEEPEPEPDDETQEAA